MGVVEEGVVAPGEVWEERGASVWDRALRLLPSPTRPLYTLHTAERARRPAKKRKNEGVRERRGGSPLVLMLK